MSAASEADMGPAMAVSLVTLTKQVPTPSAAPADPLSVLTARLQSSEPPVYTAPKKKPGSTALNAMVDRLVQQAPAPAAPSPAPSAAQIVRTSATESPQQPAAAPKQGPHADGQADGGAATGNLWGQIEPCWRNLGGRVAVPVSLQVTLDANGHLARPPVILRGNAALDERRLTAEAAALQALGACLPRGDPRLSGRIYRLDFPPS